ncbi:hypothetical protein [Streptomyces sp. CC208A]|uniref:hypothetical protein n=1 Tax=Streptomyces sp. CC208A TaxID=3044573 RepID=UPI0024A925B1|nr:hypothetical protein [Streptomyces sp. CC208A]
MPIIGPGPNDPENDNWDPSWENQDTPFRRWLYEKLTAARCEHAADAAHTYAPANRYNGLDDTETGLLAVLADVDFDTVRAAHKADLDDWAREQQLRDHPDLVVLDADLDRIRRRS